MNLITQFVKKSELEHISNKSEESEELIQEHQIVNLIDKLDKIKKIQERIICNTDHCQLSANNEDQFQNSSLTSPSTRQ